MHDNFVAIKDMFTKTRMLGKGKKVNLTDKHFLNLVH